MGGGASVDTVLHDPRVYPGGVLHGTVNIVGGHTDRDVNFVELALTARVEVETEDSEYDSNVVFVKKRISGPFRLQTGARIPIPFTFEVPWETPFNEVAGTSLHGVRVGIRTELDIAKSVDKGDVDQIRVLALPAQERIVAAFAEIGFRLKGSDLERGHLTGSRLPFYQEVEFYPANHFRGQMQELEVKFVTHPHGMDVVLEIDRRSVFGSSDKTNRFSVDSSTIDSQNWAAVLNDHLSRIMGGGAFGGVDSRAAPQLHAPVGPPPYNPPPPPPPRPVYVAPPAAPPPAARAINLTKGGNINLSKQAQGLTAVSVGLGWDVSGYGAAIDIDASAVVTGVDGRALSDAHFVFFNNLTSPDGAVQHAGDNATGAGGGDDEQIHVDLVRLAPQADRVSFAVSIHDGQAVQNFGQVRNAYIRVVNRADGREITRYDLSQQSNNETAMIFGELYRHGPDWKFRAVGQGFVEGLAGVIRSFGLSA